MMPSSAMRRKRRPESGYGCRRGLESENEEIRVAGVHRAYTSVEICAGAGGQAIGLEDAGFHHLALVEIAPHACDTLEANAERMGWEKEKIFRGDVRSFDPAVYGIEPGAIDLLAGG